jgi:hypothetical protein
MEKNVSLLKRTIIAALPLMMFSTLIAATEGIDPESTDAVVSSKKLEKRKKKTAKKGKKTTITRVEDPSELTENQHLIKDLELLDNAMNEGYFKFEDHSAGTESKSKYKSLKEILAIFALAQSTENKDQMSATLKEAKEFRVGEDNIDITTLATIVKKRNEQREGLCISQKDMNQTKENFVLKDADINLEGDPDERDITITFPTGRTGKSSLESLFPRGCFIKA